MTLKRRTVLSGAALAAGIGPGCWVCDSAWAAPAQPGERVAWPEVRLLDGRPWGAAQAQGRAVVVVFWSIRCPFCVRHNAHVEKLRLAAQSQKRALEVLTVVQEADAQAVRHHLSAYGLGFAVTQAWGPMQAALSARKGTPVTVLVSRDGRLKQLIPGEMFEEDVLELLNLG